MNILIGIIVTPFFLLLLLEANRRQERNLLAAHRRRSVRAAARAASDIDHHSYHRRSRQLTLALFPISALAAILHIADYQAARNIICIIGGIIAVGGIVYHGAGYLKLLRAKADDATNPQG